MKKLLNIFVARMLHYVYGMITGHGKKTEKCVPPESCLWSRKMKKMVFVKFFSMITLKEAMLIL